MRRWQQVRRCGNTTVGDLRQDLLRGFFRIGMFIGLGGLALALWQPLDSPEFVLSVCSSLMGGALMLGVALVVRLSR